MRKQKLTNSFFKALIEFELSQVASVPLAKSKSHMAKPRIGMGEYYQEEAHIIESINTINAL